MSNQRTIVPEIQALRAIAVSLVLLFHVWPDLLPGGYVGVDVFFVISGYLITGLLVRATMRDGHISLIDFYARRARRLLPVATLVLVATFAGTLILLPKLRWEETAIQIGASALYVQNWILAHLAVDYLGAENAASPVQHFWSLSIEEQFYFVWPVVMIAAVTLAKRLDIPFRRVIVAALSVIFLASLTASVIVTETNREWAYFVTHTRMWELALGGLLALMIHRLNVGSLVRTGMGTVGLAAIFYSSATYSSTTPFPGIAALLPTMGTVLIIMAGNIHLGRFRAFDASWLRYIGDRSYSIYLWHWPLVVFYMNGQSRVDLIDGIGLIVLTLVLSHLSYEYVEKRFRHPRHQAEWRPLGYAAVSISICLLAAGTLQYTITSDATAATSASDLNYPGPAALLEDAPVPEGVDLIPPMAKLKRDLPVVYSEKCHQNQVSEEPIFCSLGSIDGDQTMILVGDSHAAHWVPALEEIASERGWKLLTFTKSACAFSRIIFKKGGEPYPSCYAWRENVLDEIRELQPEMVIIGQSKSYGVEDHEMTEGVRGMWSDLMETGAKVVAIDDTPWMPFVAGDCLDSNERGCFALREEVASPKLFDSLAENVKGIKVVDMTDAVCGPERCEAQVGNIIVWRDRHHLTATYARTLAPHLAKKLGL